MNKQFSSAVLSALLVSAGVIGSMCACNPSAGTDDLPAVKDSTALFDDFVYQGDDDFYKENPLPDGASFYNPILPGWYSDPSICTNGEGDYFLVTSTFTYFPGVPIFHSRDLVNWKQVGNVLTRPSQLVNMKGQHVSGGIFAPAISYNPHNKTYYMVTTNVGAGNFFVKTQDPFGEWSDPIMLPEVGGIDPSFFFDEDGKAYIVNNDDAPDGKPEYDGHRTIRVQEFDVKTDKTVGPRKILVNKGVNPAEKPIWIEGPHMYKINGHYFLMDAEGGTSTWHSEVIFRGESPMGPFTPWKNNPILTQRHLDGNRPNPVTCAGHADLIQAKEGDWWAVFLACRPYEEDFYNTGRDTYLLPVNWENGWPTILEKDKAIPTVNEKEGLQPKENHLTGNFGYCDRFASDTLDIRWMFLRNPSDFYTLDGKGLALHAKPVNISQKESPSALFARQQHHTFTAETEVTFTPRSAKELAGFTLLQNEEYNFVFGKTLVGGKPALTLTRSEKETVRISTVFLDEKETAAPVKLKICGKGRYYDFYYSTGGDWTLMARGVDAINLSTNRSGGFIGACIGLYATSDNPLK